MLFMLMVMLFGACNQGTTETPPLPTRIDSPEALATSQFMTQNAPPVGFRDDQAFPLIDANLPMLTNWHYEVTLAFNGVFTGTPRPAFASTLVNVWYNQLDSARRVVLEASGIVGGEEQQEVIRREGVRLGPDTYLVPQDNVCQAEAGEDAVVLADFRIGELIGGVTTARSTSINGIINGEQVWGYAFTETDLNLPGIRFGENSRITNLTGELWISPEHNVVVRYWLTMQVENVVVNVLSENPDSALPVTGEFIIRYDLFDIGINPNISQPFGC